ncbi:MAG: hypothetical protein M1819_002123 [Sarea resinae]|nr:MAG: hypothetical protein M1819_002123 [Sarea resinae]
MSGLISKDHRLPKILCLHGGGSSAAIFSIQTRKLRHALRNDFRFVFVDAPFECEAGPGVLPIFEGSGPFSEWLRDGQSEQQEAKQLEVVQAILDDVLQEQGPFAGVLGFSQGARIAAGLLLREEEQRLEDERTGICRDYLHFGVFLCGTFPAIQWSTPSPQSVSKSDVRRHDLVSTPTVHLHGSHDPWRMESKLLLARFFDPLHASVMDFSGGHNLPLLGSDTDKLAKLIMAVYRSGNDRNDPPPNPMDPKHLDEIKIRDL